MGLVFARFSGGTTDLDPRSKTQTNTDGQHSKERKAIDDVFDPHTYCVPSSPGGVVEWTLHEVIEHCSVDFTTKV